MPENRVQKCRNTTMICCWIELGNHTLANRRTKTRGCKCYKYEKYRAAKEWRYTILKQYISMAHNGANSENGYMCNGLVFMHYLDFTFHNLVEFIIISVLGTISSKFVIGRIY